MGFYYVANYTGQTSLAADNILGICNLYGSAPIIGATNVICGGRNATYTSPYPTGTFTWDQSSNINAPIVSGNSATFTAKTGVANNGPGWIAIKVGSLQKKPPNGTDSFFAFSFAQIFYMYIFGYLQPLNETVPTASAHLKQVR